MRFNADDWKNIEELGEKSYVEWVLRNAASIYARFSRYAPENEHDLKPCDDELRGLNIALTMLRHDPQLRPSIEAQSDVSFLELAIWALALHRYRLATVSHGQA